MRRQTLAQRGLLSTLFLVACSSTPPDQGGDDDDDSSTSDDDDDADDDDDDDDADDDDDNDDGSDDDDDDDDVTDQTSDDDDDDDSSDDDDDSNSSDDDDDDDDDDSTPDPDCQDSTEDAEASALDFSHNVFASPSPPGGLAPKDTPQIVVIGWDDVENVPGMTFVNELLESVTNPNGKKAGTNLNPNACYGQGWADAAQYACGDGSLSQQRDLVTKNSFDIANHTVDHLESNSTWSGIPAAWKDSETQGWKFNEDGYGPGVGMDESTWKTVLQANDTALKAIYTGISITGFRAPRLELNDAGLRAVRAMNYQYDQTLEEILPENMVDAAVSLDGTKGEGFNWVTWPYSLDNGSPGIWAQQEGGDKPWVIDYPQGLIEVPVYMAYISTASGLGKVIADRMMASDKSCTFPEGTPEDQKDHCFLSDGELMPGDSIKEVTAFDFNTFIYSRFTKEDWLTTFKNTFLLRYHGNRAPLTFGTHPVQYSEPYDSATLGTQANNFGFRDVLDYNRYTDRQAALKEFVAWVKDNYPNDAYFMSAKQVADFMENPHNTKGEPAPKDEVATPASNGVFNRLGWNTDSASITVTDGNTAELTFNVTTLDTQVAVDAGLKTGALKGVTHIDVEYETEVPFRIRLIADGKPSTSVLLAGVGGTRRARIRTKDFVVDSQASPADIAKLPLVDAAYLESVTGLAFESAATTVTGTKTFKASIKQITLHGVATKDLCNP